MASFAERNVRIDNIKLKEVVKQKPNHIWKIAENISDVNRAAPIIHARERTSLNRAVFLGISFNITSVLTF